MSLQMPKSRAYKKASPDTPPLTTSQKQHHEQYVNAKMGQIKWGALEVRMCICIDCRTCMRIGHVQSK
jgi:hypothetical protein